MRSPRVSPRGPAADLAARRLALIAADLGRDEEWWADHTRIAAQPAADRAPAAPVPPAGLPEPRAAEPSEPPPLPRPGRHASRRRSPLSAALPTLQVPALGPAHVTVVALLAALGLAATAWWVVRGDAEQGVAPVAAGTAAPLVAAASPSGSTTTAPGAAPEAAPSTASSTASVTVDVTGDVRRPGIVVLDAGARVVDAVEAAGGARRGVDLSGLNLARVLVDGEQIVVGAPAVAGPAPTGPVAPSGSPGVPTTLVNLNLATPAELETLPDVGPVTAAAIVAWREEHGGFTSVDELLEVDGIGEVTLEKLAPYVTV